MLLFKPGVLTITPGAMERLTELGIQPATLLRRHFHGDWGDLYESDKARNKRAVEEGTRILSVYGTRLGERVYVITEADRSATTILLPEEY